MATAHRGNNPDSRGRTENVYSVFDFAKFLTVWKQIVVAFRQGKAEGQDREVVEVFNQAVEDGERGKAEGENIDLAWLVVKVLDNLPEQFFPAIDGGFKKFRQEHPDGARNMVGEIVGLAGAGNLDRHEVESRLTEILKKYGVAGKLAEKTVGVLADFADLRADVNRKGMSEEEGVKQDTRIDGFGQRLKEFWGTIKDAFPSLGLIGAIYIVALVFVIMLELWVMKMVLDEVTNGKGSKEFQGLWPFS